MVDSRAANEWPQVLRGYCGVSALSTTSCAAQRPDAGWALRSNRCRRPSRPGVAGWCWWPRTRPTALQRLGLKGAVVGGGRAGPGGRPAARATPGLVGGAADPGLPRSPRLSGQTFGHAPWMNRSKAHTRPMGGPTLNDYREMLSPGLEDLIAEVLAPAGFAGHSMVQRRDDGGIRHELRFSSLARTRRCVRTGALLQLSVALQPRSRHTSSGAWCPAVCVSIRVPVRARGARHGGACTRSGHSTPPRRRPSCCPVHRTDARAQVVCRTSQPRRTVEGLLEALDKASLARHEPPPDYQPDSRSRRGRPPRWPCTWDALETRSGSSCTAYGEDAVPPPRICTGPVRGRSAA